MANDKPRLRKHEIEHVLGGGNSALQTLYYRARSHVPMDYTNDQLLEALVFSNDIPMVRRSLDVFGYIADSPYVDYPRLRLSGVEGVPEQFKVTLGFNTALGFMVPGYLAKVTNVNDLPMPFLDTFGPAIEQLTELKRMHIAANTAWNKVENLCGGNLARMRRMWPAIDTIGKQLGIDLSLLPKPQGCPAADLELRELITTGTAFINSVLLMPPAKKVDRGYELDIGV